MPELASRHGASGAKWREVAPGEGRPVTPLQAQTAGRTHGRPRSRGPDDTW